MWGTAEGGSGTLFITVLLLDEMRTSWMYYGRVQAFCNAPFLFYFESLSGKQNRQCPGIKRFRGIFCLKRRVVADRGLHFQ